MRTYGVVLFLLLPLVLSAQVVERKVLDSLLSSGALLLDVRSKEDFEKGSIKGALHLPLKDIEQFGSFHPVDKPVVVFCNTGRQSAQAVEKLRAMGEKNIYDGKNLGRITASLHNLFFEPPGSKTENKATVLWSGKDATHKRLFLSKDKSYQFAAGGDRILYLVKGEVELTASKQSLYTEGDQIVLPSQEPATLRALSSSAVVLIIENKENTQ